MGAEEARARRVVVATGPDLMREEHAQTSMTARSTGPVSDKTAGWGIGGGSEALSARCPFRNSYIQAKFREKRHNRPFNPTNNQDHLAEDPPCATKEVIL